jgi:hypothetical protein
VEVEQQEQEQATILLEQWFLLEAEVVQVAGKILLEDRILEDHEEFHNLASVQDFLL